MIQIDNVHSRVWGREGLAQLGSRAKGCLVGDGHRYFLLATSILHTYRPPLLLLAVFPRCELLAIFTTALYRSLCTPPCDNLSLSPLFDGEYLILYTLMLHLTFNRQHGRLYDKCVENRGVGNLRLLAFHLLDSLLTTTTSISICPHMTSFSTKMDITRVALAKLLPMNISFQ